MELFREFAPFFEFERFSRCLGLPAIDTKDTPSGFIIEADVPGIPKSNITLNVEPDAMELIAKRPPPLAVDTRPYMQERCFGDMRRVIRIPPGVDPSTAQARLDDGVLTVTLQRRQGQDYQKSVPIS